MNENTAEISFPRWWIENIRDGLVAMGKLPTGPLGDWAFIFREQLTDKLNAPLPGAVAQDALDRDTIATLTNQVLSYQQQLEDKAELREAIVMAENRLEAALIGDEVCKDCVELARSYLTDALAGSVALPSTSSGSAAK